MMIGIHTHVFDNVQGRNGCNNNWTLGSRFPLDAALTALCLLSCYTCVWMTRCTLDVRTYGITGIQGQKRQTKNK